MKHLLMLIIITLASTAEARRQGRFRFGPCMDLSKAQDMVYLQVIKKPGLEVFSDIIPFCSQSSGEQYYQEECIAEEDVMKAIYRLSWNEERYRFESPTVYEWYCAAGAECWIGLTLECDGTQGVWFEGED
jgi:hypothetical protein